MLCGPFNDFIEKEPLVPLGWWGKLPRGAHAVLLWTHTLTLSFCAENTALFLVQTSVVITSGAWWTVCAQECSQLVFLTCFSSVCLKFCRGQRVYDLSVWFLHWTFQASCMYFDMHTITHCRCTQLVVYRNVQSSPYICPRAFLGFSFFLCTLIGLKLYVLCQFPETK